MPDLLSSDRRFFLLHVFPDAAAAAGAGAANEEGRAEIAVWEDAVVVEMTDVAYTDADADEAMTEIELATALSDKLGLGTSAEWTALEAGAVVSAEEAGEFEGAAIGSLGTATEEGAGARAGAGTSPSAANRSVCAPFMKPISWLSTSSARSITIAAQVTHNKADRALLGSCCCPCTSIPAPAQFARDRF